MMDLSKLSTHKQTASAFPLREVLAYRVRQGGG
jgi:hypothetical protein